MDFVRSHILQVLKVVDIFLSFFIIIFLDKIIFYNEKGNDITNCIFFKLSRLFFSLSLKKSNTKHTWKLSHTLQHSIELQY